MSKQAVAYCRVSSRGQAAGDKVSLRDQELYCRNLALQQDLELAGVYVEARSGTSDEIADRPELIRMLNFVEGAGIEYVIVYSQDRLARNMDAGSDIGRRLRKAGVAVLTPDGVLDLRRFDGKLLYQVKSILADNDARSMKQRLHDRKRAYGQQGLFVFAQRLYGYKWRRKNRAEGEDARPLPIEAELEIVRLIFDLAAKHHTSHGIAKTLTERGYRPREASTWRASMVARILGDERYCGKWVTWSGDFRQPGDVEGHPEDKGKEWEAQAQFVPEPAVPRKVWLAAQRSKAHHRKRTRRKLQHAFLLAGVGRCAHCGSLLVGRVVSRQPQTRYYACSMGQRDKLDRSDCPAGYIPAVPLEREVWGRVERLIENPELLREAAALTEREERPAKEKELERLERGIAMCKREVKNLIRKLGKDLISDEDFLARRRELDADWAAWEERAAELRAWIEESDAKAATVDAAADLLANMRGKLDSLEERRRLLRLLDFRVEVGAEDWSRRKDRQYKVKLESVLFAYDPAATRAGAVSSDLP